MGTEALEKIFFILVMSSAGCRALQIRRIGEAAGGFQQAYYIEGTQLWKKGIFKKKKMPSALMPGKGNFPDWKRNIIN